MNPYQTAFLPGLLLFLMMSFLSGCVSLSKYEDLESNSNGEMARLNKEIAALNSQKNSQEAALTSEKMKLQEEISGLKLQKADLENKKSALDHDFITLNDQLGQIEKQSAAVKAEKETLDHDVILLNDRLANAEKEAAEIKAQKEQEISRLKETYDSLVSNLKGEIEKGDIKVTQIRNRLTVNLVEKVLFDSGQAAVKSKGKEILKRVGKILRDITDKEIRIEGYTDNIPIGGTLREKFPTNWELSTERATNVLRFLEEEAGVPGERLSATGYGPFHPVAGNETPQGRAENRRIEILLAPFDTQELLKSIK
jgi:chemotaxis protein MotB